MDSVIYTKKFNSYLRDLQQKGQKKIVQAVRAAMAEAGTNGCIESLPRTKHGETRLKQVEKFDLPDAYRLIVQLVDGKQKTRAFLFVGDHADAEKWLDNHKNYVWVKSPSDGTLNFMPVTHDANRHIPYDRLDLDSPESELAAPLLRHLSDDEWANLECSPQQKELAKKITGENFEQDAMGILEKLDSLGTYESASLLLDLFTLSHNKEWVEFKYRLVTSGKGNVIADADNLQAEMSSINNAEQFVTFDDEGMLDDFFSKNSFSDWMLFLHPEQKKIAQRDYKGPARLRGVSGSGKTSVLVHRARYLAKKYSQPVLLVTLTESMRKLLEKLVDELCGAEKSLIVTRTMNSLGKEVLLMLSNETSPQMITAEQQQKYLESVKGELQSAEGFAKTPFAQMTDTEFDIFLKEEFEYIRGRLRPSLFFNYLDSNQFNRRGRGIPLNKVLREHILQAVTNYTSQVVANNLYDHELIVSKAVDLLLANNNAQGLYRCILSDEVQDLTELDLVMLSQLMTPQSDKLASVENGLFLAGDGAQSIYKRGFALKRAGIDVIGRSVSLKKNYRNTHEILSAAFNLVSEYEFADTDEDEICQPVKPDFAKRHGPRPLLLQCNNPEDEVQAVAQKVYALMAAGQTAGQICIIAPQSRLREGVKSALLAKSIPSAELKQDVDYESDNVKVSTIESAKGHEFASVFIMGLVEGVFPNTQIREHEIAREASRLYVAMTRARETLIVTYSPSQSYPASRFLLAVQKDCEEAKYRNGEIIPLRE